MTAEAPTFPPLFEGMAAQGVDPFALACTEAARGCDAGLVVHDLAHDRLKAAMVFAPDVALREAVVMLPLCGVGFQHALGALAPAEVAVHLGWDGPIYVNGGRCGALQIAAAPTAPEQVPDWLVVGLSLDLWPATEDTGLTPDRTALYAEGCAEVDAQLLLEAWVRHTLVEINAWEEGGTARLHRDWLGLARDLGKAVEIDGRAGTFQGLDENFGMLLKTDTATDLIPLTHLMTDTP
jgi:BirA family transcriptional regulator, biotin operon repressor / biotin---[acetyl-CoA-carboxylase] ligase